MKFGCTVRFACVTPHRMKYNLSILINVAISNITSECNSSYVFKDSVKYSNNWFLKLVCISEFFRQGMTVKVYSRIMTSDLILSVESEQRRNVTKVFNLSCMFAYYQEKMDIKSVRVSPSLDK